MNFKNLHNEHIKYNIKFFLYKMNYKTILQLSLQRAGVGTTILTPSTKTGISSPPTIKIETKTQLHHTKI